MRKSIGRDYVVLLHGLGRTRLSMHLLSHRLGLAGFECINLGYPSRQHDVTELARIVQNKLSRIAFTSGRPVHFVTHSLGGIVLRKMLQVGPIPNIGRAVMLSPPNDGSELTDILKNSFLYKWATGPAGQQLGTPPHGLPGTLGPPSCPVGVITGNISTNLLFRGAFPGPNDGKVSVERAKLPGMADFLVVAQAHTFIMNSPEVARHTALFLRTGSFQRWTAGANGEAR